MKTQIQKTKIYAKLLCTALLATFSVTAVAQERVVLQASFANNAQPFKIDVLVGQSRVIDFDQPYDRVSVSDNKIAEVVPVSEKQVLINGLAFGQVNVVPGPSVRRAKRRRCWSSISTCRSTCR
jgi:Flp pilus assembly secretin CpaC